MLNENELNHLQSEENLCYKYSAPKSHHFLNKIVTPSSYKLMESRGESSVVWYCRDRVAHLLQVLQSILYWMAKNWRRHRKLSPRTEDGIVRSGWCELKGMKWTARSWRISWFLDVPSDFRLLHPENYFLDFLDGESPRHSIYGFNSTRYFCHQISKAVTYKLLNVNLNLHCQSVLITNIRSSPFYFIKYVSVAPHLSPKSKNFMTARWRGKQTEQVIRSVDDSGKVVQEAERRHLKKQQQTFA